MENVLVQKFGLRKLKFTLTNEGVIRKEKMFLNVGSSEKLYSYQNLGIDIENKSNNEGVPTLLIMTVMSVIGGIVVVKEIQFGNISALAYAGITIAFLLVMVHMIQKYITRTYEITGGSETLSLLRYRDSEERTLAFIDLLNARTKASLINRYNDLVADIKPNPVFKVGPRSASYKLSDEEFRELQKKTEYLFISALNSLMESDREAEQPWR
jgi:drug/metabolite transporter superfamily protein YnfA